MSIRYVRLRPTASGQRVLDYLQAHGPSAPEAILEALWPLRDSDWRNASGRREGLGMALGSLARGGYALLRDGLWATA